MSEKTEIADLNLFMKDKLYGSLSVSILASYPVMGMFIQFTSLPNGLSVILPVPVVSGCLKSKSVFMPKSFLSIFMPSALIPRP